MGFIFGISASVDVSGHLRLLLKVYGLAWILSTGKAGGSLFHGLEECAFLGSAHIVPMLVVPRLFRILYGNPNKELQWSL